MGAEAMLDRAVQASDRGFAAGRPKPILRHGDAERKGARRHALAAAAVAGHGDEGRLRDFEGDTSAPAGAMGARVGARQAGHSAATFGRWESDASSAFGS
jgi:hypothetical protein